MPQILVQPKQLVKNSPVFYIWSNSCASVTKIPLTPHLANQTGHWESTENEKSLPGTIKGIPTNGSSRLNALCDYLKLWKTS